MFISMVLLNISPHIISDKPSPKDKYVAYAIKHADYELAADVYNINVTSLSDSKKNI